jgi:hypothetical protein
VKPPLVGVKIASTVTNTNTAATTPTTLTTQSPRVENEQEQAGIQRTQVNLRNHEESVDTMSETVTDDEDSVATAAAVESIRSPAHNHTSLAERCREPCMVVLNNVTTPGT